MTAFTWALASMAALTVGALGTRVIADARTARRIAVAAAAASVGFGSLAVAWHDGGHLGARAAQAFGLDGLSAPFLPFVSALVLVAVLTVPSASATRGRFSRTLLGGVVMLAFHLARTPGFTAALWTISAIPLYAELRAVRGSSRTGLAGRAFVAYMVASSLFVATGLYLATVAPSLHAWAVPILLLGILVRKGVVPFQSWVPELFESGPLGMISVFTQTHAGGYLLVRMLATQSIDAPPAFLDAVGIATALYGALLATVQTNARRALGYFSLSQSALVFTGIAEGGVVGVGGSVLMIFGTGLAQAGFVAALACLEARRGALRTDRPSGGHDRTPALAGVFLFLGLASVGLPGTLGFVGEDLVFHAALAHRPWVGVGMVLATAVNGVNVLRLSLSLFGGARRRAGELDLLRRERVALVGLAVSLVALGFFPGLVLGPVEDGLSALRERSAATTPQPMPSALRMRGSGASRFGTKASPRIVSHAWM